MKTYPLSKVLLLFVIVGFVVYFHILFNGFVWDDLTYIIGNPELKGFNLSVLLGPNTFNSSGYFRPLPAVYFSILLNLFGNNAFFYHFSQLSLHIACVTLLFLFLYKFFSQKLSVLLSLLFLIHPINVESVAYIGATQSQLYFLFGGLALYLSLKDSLPTKRVLLIHLFLLLALLTKEVSFIYVLLIYFYRLLFYKKINKYFILSTLITLITYLYFRFSVLHGVLQKMHMIPISEIPLIDRLAHIPIIVFYYIKTLFYPKVLAIDQIWTISNISLSNFYLPLAVDITVIAALAALLRYFFRRSKESFRLLVFFSVWLVAGMSLLLQIFPLDMTVADRWFYMPFVGLLGIIGVLIHELAKTRFAGYAKIAIRIFGAVLILLSLRTMVRNADWYSTLTLYSHDVKYFDNYDIENYLGADLAFAGRQQEALPHFLKSARLLPHDTNLYNVGSVYERLGDLPNAGIYYEKTLDYKSDYSSHNEVRKLAFEGLGRILVLNEKPELARPRLVQAVTEYPDNGTLWAFMAINEYTLNNYKEASSAAVKANKLLPNATTAKLLNLIQNRKKIDLRLN